MQALEEEIERLKAITNNKVDKALMKNMLIGYFHAPLRKREEALIVSITLVFGVRNYT